jgi:hypothetical protein
VAVLYTISQSGSYYLTGNRNCGFTGIAVDADDVTIDLMGYALIGPGSGQGGGIEIDTRNNVEIRNGTIRGFGKGIEAHGGYHKVENVRIVSNLSFGILLYGDNNLIKDCLVTQNGHGAASAKGISTRDGSTVTGNIVYDNGNSTAGSVYGIDAGNGCTLTGNTVKNNGDTSGGINIYGISVGQDCTISGNTVSNNGTSITNSNYNIYGINVSNGCTVIGNTSSSNGKSIAGGGGDTGKIYGIKSGMNCLVANNTAHANGESTSSYTDIYGISVDVGTSVRSNTVSKNGSLASAASIRGIQTGSGCTVIGNTAFENGMGTMGTGISLGDDNFVDQNTAVGNFGTNMNTPGSGLITSDNYAP